MDILMDNGDDIRQYVRVPSLVQITVGVVLVFSFAGALLVIVNLTCCRRRTIKDAQADAAKLARTDALDELDKDTSGQSKLKIIAFFKAAYDAFDYHTGTQSPYFYRAMWASEVVEIFFQILAIDVSVNRRVGRGKKRRRTTMRTRRKRRSWDAYPYDCTCGHVHTAVSDFGVYFCVLTLTLTALQPRLAVVSNLAKEDPVVLLCLYTLPSCSSTYSCRLSQQWH